MTKHPTYRWQEAPENEEEIISKSQIKRDAQALKDLGETLTELSKVQLSKIPLDADLLSAIELAQKLKMEARRRQLQFIGKLLRNRDVAPINAALDVLKNKFNQQIVLFHQIEKWRDRLIQEGDDVISELLEVYPDADRQKLRTLIRMAKKEQENNKSERSYRQIFQYVKELTQNK